MSQQLCIIIPVLNGERFIAEALTSVESQRSGSVQIVVVDGGSTDSTVAMASVFEDVRLEILAGSSLYEALNRGIELSDSEIIGFLNSDDLYAPGAIATALEALDRNPHAAVVSGGAEVFSNSRSGAQLTLTSYASPQRTALNLDNVMLGVPLLNARFYRRETLKSLGGFDCSYSIAADRDLLIRTVLSAVTEVAVPNLFYRYRMHGGSITMSGRHERSLAMARQNMALARKYMKADRHDSELCGKAERMYYDSIATALNAGVRGDHWTDAVSVFLEGAQRERSGILKIGGAVQRKLRRRMKKPASI